MNNNLNYYKNILINIPKLIHLESKYLEEGDNIPIKYTKVKDGGKNIMLPLKWTIIPDINQYSLFCIDLHKVAQKFVHLYVPKIVIDKNGDFNMKKTFCGKNSFGTSGWGGPKPPLNTTKHKYVFYILALNNNVIIPNDERNKCRDLEDFIINVCGGIKNINCYGCTYYYYIST